MKRVVKSAERTMECSYRALVKSKNAKKKLESYVCVKLWIHVLSSSTSAKSHNVLEITTTWNNKKQENEFSFHLRFHIFAFNSFSFRELWIFHGASACDEFAARCLYGEVLLNWALWLFVKNYHNSPVLWQECLRI